MEVFSFLILFIILVFFAVYYIQKDGNNIIQPHALYTGTIVVLLVLIPFFQFYFTDLFLDRKGIIFTNAMIGLSYLFFSLGFFLKKEKGLTVLNHFIRKFDIKTIPPISLNVHLIIMLSIGLLFFIAVAQKSGFGLFSWLDDPRTGYQFYRRGLGHFYVVSLAIFSFAYLYLLFFKIKTLKSLFLATMSFVSIFYFFGSKGIIIFTILEAIVFYNFFLKKIEIRKAIIMFVSLFLVFALVFSLYAPNEDARPLSIKILSYADHYQKGSMFFADFEEDFQYAYGEEYINSLWAYVPRAFYPDKPYAYGFVKYVNEHYFPGQAELGDTPAFGGPVEEYLNFGVIGVIVVGFIKGYFSSLFYNYFLKYRNFVGFVLLSNEMSFSIFPIIEVAGYKILWYLVNIFILLFHKQIISGCARINKQAS